MNRLLALLAFLTFSGFVGILAYKVPSPDLIIIVVLTTMLLAYDFMTSGRGGPKE